MNARYSPDFGTTCQFKGSVNTSHGRMKIRLERAASSQFFTSLPRFVNRGRLGTTHETQLPGGQAPLVDFASVPERYCGSIGSV